MSTPALEWVTLTDRKCLLELQHFTCTADRPRTPGGRTLSAEKPWEWEAQALLRSVSQRLKSNESVLVGRTASLTEEIAAAAWLEFHELESMPGVFIKACGVSRAFRGQGGEVGDEMMSRILAAAEDRLRTTAASRLQLHGMVDTRNSPSENLLARAMLEPVGLPRGDYQQWALILEVE